MSDLTLADGTVLEPQKNGDVYVYTGKRLVGIYSDADQMLMPLTREVAAREKAERERDAAIKEIGKQGELRGKAEAQVEVLREALEGECIEGVSKDPWGIVRHRCTLCDGSWMPNEKPNHKPDCALAHQPTEEARQ